MRSHLANTNHGKEINMHKILKSLVLACTLVLVSGLATAALAQHQKATQKTAKAKPGKKAAKTEIKFLAQGDGIDSCIVSGETLHSKTISSEIFGRTVYFCCKDCQDTALKNPAAYVKKTEAEQIAAVRALAKSHENHDHHAAEPKAGAAKFLGKGDGVETCPVTGEAIDKSVTVEVDGRTVYACCPGCLDKIKNNPELYLKPVKK